MSFHKSLAKIEKYLTSRGWKARKQETITRFTKSDEVIDVCVDESDPEWMGWGYGQMYCGPNDDWSVDWVVSGNDPHDEVLDVIKETFHED